MKHLKWIAMTAILVAMLLPKESRVSADTLAETPQNFSSVASISIKNTGPTDTKFTKQEAKYNAPLTGKTKWHGFYSQSGRNIDMDLTYDRPIQSLSIDMEQNQKIGIYYPAYVDFQVNEGGTWYEIGRVNTKIPQTDAKVTTQTFKITCNNIYGHLFRIHFPVDVWVFARNLNIIGNSFSLPGSQTMPELPKAATGLTGPMFKTDDRAHGINNMLLVYTGDHGSVGTWTTHDFLPMTAYLTSDGTIGNRMMDSVLFLPYGTMKDTQQGWLTYLQDLFKSGQDLDALNAAEAATNAGMNRWGDYSNKKENVILSLPYPHFGDGTWGTIDGQTITFAGTKNDPSAVTARTQALNWYLTTALQMWNKAGYQDLKLDGIYWVSENIKIAVPGETQVIANVSKAVHANNLPFDWIPYYGAAGIEDWASYGFDAAWLQPNYVEAGKNADPLRLQNTEALAKDSGLGVEVEAPWQILSNPTYQALYQNTLGTFESDGFAGRVSHAFYEDSKVLCDAAYSSDPNVRALYDETYGFITNP